MSELRNAWTEYITGFADWRSFWSLTFSEQDRTHDVTRDEATFLFRRLIQSLNRNLFGNNYTRIVGHCYFSYAIAYEFQKKGTLHIHVLADRRTNWQLINRLWRQMAGICLVEPVSGRDGAAKYMSKYVSKGGDVMLYRPDKIKEPSFAPLWYLGY